MCLPQGLSLLGHFAVTASLLSDRQDSYCCMPGISASHRPFLTHTCQAGPSGKLSSPSTLTSSAGNSDGIRSSSQHSPGSGHLSYCMLKASSLRGSEVPPPVQKLQAVCQRKTVLSKSLTLGSGRKPHGQLDRSLSDAGMSSYPCPSTTDSCLPAASFLGAVCHLSPSTSSRPQKGAGGVCTQAV